MPSRNLPIRHKLTGVILLTSLSVLALTCGVLAVYEIHSNRQALARSLSTLTDMIAANSAEAVLFDDPNVAREILVAVRADPEVAAAALYTTNGTLYAYYPTHLAPSDFPPLPAGDGVQFHPDHLAIYKSITRHNHPAGVVFLKGDLTGMYRRLQVYGLVLLSVVACAAVLALLLSNIFQQRFTRPLLELAQTAKTVSTSKDYSLRATKMSEDELGDLTEAFNSMLDQIQEQDRALRISEERGRAILNSALSAVVVMDARGRIADWNPRAETIFGWTQAEATGQDLTKLILPARGHEAQRDALARFLAPGRSPRLNHLMELTAIRRDGHEFPVELCVARVETGDQMMSCAFIMDITERKRVEHELKCARDTALAASRTKDDFLAALSHELRTPLNPVLLLATEEAANEQLPTDVRATFETIARNVGLEARLINDLLDLTRITRGKLSLELRAVDAHAALQDAVAAVRSELTEKKITLGLDLGADERIVWGDDVRLQQIFWNVVNNAVKFTPEGGSISVETFARADRNRFAVRVTDTGIGMTPEELERAFNAFSQGDHARKGPNRFGGIGLGLAISRMLAEMQGGSITAASSGRGRGSTILVELPLMRAANRVTEDTPNLPLARIATKSARCRVLLVEDHEPTRATLAQLLGRRAFEVVSAGSVAEASTLAKQEQFDILISDIGLPDGNGYDLMATLRESYGLKGIALTGYGMDQDIARSDAAGFVAHLTKPVSIQSLESALAAATSAP